MNKLVILDSNSLMNRAFYAMPPLNSQSGQPTNAVFGYINILMKIIKDIKPTHIIATFDRKEPTFRKKIFDDYKAHRKPMPEELVVQMPIIKELLTLMDIQVVELAGYEADDLIGTLALQCKERTIIVTGDKDSLQLVSDSTTVWLTKRGVTEVIEYTPERLLEDGLTPSQVIELKALMGDSSDNIPGVAGVGEKTAKELLLKYKDLDGVYNNIAAIKGKLQEKLIGSRDIAYLSRTLATIDVNSPIEYDDSKCKLIYPFSQEVYVEMTRLNFKSIIPRIEFLGTKVTDENFKPPSEVVEITNNTDFLRLLERIRLYKGCAIVVANKINISTDGGIEYRITPPTTFFDELENDVLINGLKDIFEDDSIAIITYDIKNICYGLPISKYSNCDDIGLIAYLVKANVNYKSYDEILVDYGVDTVFPAAAMVYLFKMLMDRLEQMKCVRLYKDLELPLIRTLYDMEIRGVKIDKTLMQSLGQKYLIEISLLTNDIYEMAGVEFKINSPKQLGEILFDKLNLAHGKKNKTGNYSTDVNVLDNLRGTHPIIELIMRYREINKLLSTYINGMELLLDNQNRLHTIFKQMVTATGRLSSTEPNLQNIPVRRAEGRELRKMFIASSGNKLVCADYSQIELRLLAHFSADKTLIEAFNNGADIHAFTASKVNGVPLSMVTPEMRSRSKAVNFGIIYGISDFGLSNDIGCSPREARTFIEQYFETYAGVKTYLDGSIASAYKNGYISTILGRVRAIPDLKSANFNIRKFGERVAMNMPLQGSASDIIKVAMLRVHGMLISQGYRAKLVLQVHDELMIDCPIDEVEGVSKLLRECMESAVKLLVPLVAEVKVGGSWYETK